MKPFLLLFLLVLTIASGWAQQALVNPTSVTLTHPGAVTVLVTGKTTVMTFGGSSMPRSYVQATVGTITAIYDQTLYTSSVPAVMFITGSSVATGTLDAGTYSVNVERDARPDIANPDPIDSNPYQITVILWNESTEGSGIALNTLTLSYQSATDADKAAFQALIVSLVQQQLSALQGQITAQQNQIAALQDSGAANTSTIHSLQEQLASMQSNFNTLLGQFDTVNARLAQLETRLAGLNAPNGATSTSETENNTSDKTTTYIGIGLGAAGVVGALINAVFDFKPNAPLEEQ